MSERQDLEHYLALPYTVQLQRDGDHWFAQVVELPGCMTEGDSATEAAEMILDALTGWIATALEDGLPIPEPRPVEDYSGRFVVRVPRSLHRDLVCAAEREGVSLNQYINLVLSQTAGQSFSYARIAEARSVHQPLSLSHAVAEEEAKFDPMRP